MCAVVVVFDRVIGLYCLALLVVIAVVSSSSVDVGVIFVDIYIGVVFGIVGVVGVGFLYFIALPSSSNGVILLAGAVDGGGVFAVGVVFVGVIGLYFFSLLLAIAVVSLSTGGVAFVLAPLPSNGVTLPASLSSISCSPLTCLNDSR